MDAAKFTTDQRRAIEVVGAGAMVSAAAGSGKTATLSERCAYLVCDAPAHHRCDVTDLLVLTFTDAAAAEMRARITDAIRARAQADPNDARLRQQAVLVDAAQISTIHSFCHWIIRHWFQEIDLDPAAAVLDEIDAAQLQAQVLDEVTEAYYAIGQPAAHPLVPSENPSRTSPPIESSQAATEPSVGPADLSAEEAREFVRLVDVYGLGDDREIQRFVRALHAFTCSLPAPEHWLTEACRRATEAPETYLARLIHELYGELAAQIEHCEDVLTGSTFAASCCDRHASVLHEYIAALAAWHNDAASILQLATSVTADQGERPNVGNDAARLATAFDDLRQRIREYAISLPRATKKNAADRSPEEEQLQSAAKDAVEQVRNKLLRTRLRNGACAFSFQQWIEGVRATAPFVRAVVTLTRRFSAAYEARKHRLGLIDFADLERKAYTILCDCAAPEQPSAIARTLQAKFAYVLVDEFQDVNPLQQAIIRIVSRETAPEQPNNLFAVGDVKQSIYRFRLAEPELFSQRWQQATTADTANPNERLIAIPLRRNFRSRPPILEAVNQVFRQLMRNSSPPYDVEAELVPFRNEPLTAATATVELHILERRDSTTGEPEDASPDDGAIDESNYSADDPRQWKAVEREAYLIATLIRRWHGSTEVLPNGAPLAYRHIAVLLRSANVNGQLVAATLHRMGVPASSRAGGSLLDTREVREIIAALQVIDNRMQDIPLSSVLRTGVFGVTLTEDELAEVRSSDRTVAFHQAAAAFAQSGESEPLRKRLDDLRRRVDRFRREFRGRPVADVLSELFDRYGYLAHACGLPGGDARRANLLKLHDFARKFGSFRRQGLHRFLHAVDAMREEQRDIAVAQVLPESADVVRITTIHQSKGIEYPVVFVAGLGNRIDLRDRNSRMIFERQAYLGLRVVDVERMIDYASAAHRAAAAEIERTTREEEARILYVAMTRAREKLVLIGSTQDAENKVNRTRTAAHRGRIGAHELRNAQCMLDWLMPTAQPPVGLSESNDAPPAPFDVHVHGADAISAWRLSTPPTESETTLLQRAARGESLDARAQHVKPAPSADLLAQLDFAYPFLAASSIRAATGAGELKRAFDWSEDPPAATHSDQSRSSFRSLTPDRAARRGVATHRVLQHLDFAAAVDRAGIDAELQRLASQRQFSADELADVDRESIAWFVSTPLAERIRGASRDYKREFSYITREPAEWIDPTVNLGDDDFVLVRGIIDGILPAQDAVEVVDFKTDQVTVESCMARAEGYRSQMTMYARATARLWKRPVRACHLVFLSAKRIVTLTNLQTDLPPT